MLDFIIELEKMLKIWPDNVKWSIVQISDKTKSKIPHVVDCLTDALGKALDVHDPMTYNEVNKAFGVLRERYRPEIEARRIRE